MEQVRHDSAQVRVRHIKRSATGTTILGVVYAGDWDGLNGRMGFVSGTLERRLYEEGTGTLRLPNSAGPDGVLHRERFACLSDPGYLPGDEWLEVYEDERLVATWTPTGRQSKRRSELQISGEDATTLLKRTREGSYGYWCHAPRDAMEHYGRVWRGLVDERFDATGPSFTYSASPQTTADGAWNYQRCEQVTAGEVQIRVPGGNQGWLRSTTPIGYVGSLITDYADSYRADFILTYDAVPSPNAQFTAGLCEAAFPVSPYYGVGKSTFFTGGIYTVASGFSGGGECALPDPPGPLRISIIKHDRWVVLLVNGRVARIGPPYSGYGNTATYPSVGIYNNSASDCVVRVQEVRARRADRLLIGDGDGDLHLPGVPTPGGLLGEYFDLAPLITATGSEAGVLAYWAFRPERDPVATRLEPTINFASSNPPAWRPATVPPTDFSARYSGAIYLDLDNKDIALRVTADEEGVLWVGKTRLTEQILVATSGTAASTWLKAGSSSGSAPSGTSGPLTGRPSGWYPIRLEYKQAGASGACQLQWEDSTAVGTWTAVPSDKLSPYGMVRDMVREESHYDALKNIADSFGYQWTCEPRSLASGQFPGRIIPRVRVGRDTERVLDEPEAVDIQADIDLDSRADLISADASGISDPSGAAQLAAEMENPDGIGHLYLGQSYESLSEIGQVEMLLQRLASLLALRSAVWEEVSARAPGHRELLDSWPLAGALAEFAWQPGDGIRLNFPTIGVVDATTRQILGVSREFVPNGMRPPAASFRPRPRSAKSLLRQVRRGALLPQRNYQQQLAVVNGSVGRSGADIWSRIAIPPAGRVVTLDLVVLDKSNGSVWLAFFNGANSGYQITSKGRVSLMAEEFATADGMFSATLNAAGVGTGTWTIQLVATVRI